MRLNLHRDLLDRFFGRIHRLGLDSLDYFRLDGFCADLSSLCLLMWKRRQRLCQLLRRSRFGEEVGLEENVIASAGFSSQNFKHRWELGVVVLNEINDLH
jgi:hypothetical protein